MFLTQNFNLLILQESFYDDIIKEDINETFYFHGYFKEANLDLEALGRICKAYAEYDARTGYFQCLSFLAASILLHVCIIIAIFFYL